MFATHDDPGYCHALSYVNQVSLAALVNSVPGIRRDHLDGAVVREAEVLGMAVPVTAAPWHLVRLREPAA